MYIYAVREEGDSLKSLEASKLAIKLCINIY